VVDFYDTERGFGFVEIEGLNDDAHVSASVIEASDLKKLGHGDAIECDIARTQRGWSVEKIHKLLESQSSVEVVKIEIVRIQQNDPYGFVNVIGTDRDALFHFSTVPQNKRESIKLGAKLKAEIYQDIGGRGWRVRKFIGL